MSDAPSSGFAISAYLFTEYRGNTELKCELERPCRAPCRIRDYRAGQLEALIGSE